MDYHSGVSNMRHREAVHSNESGGGTPPEKPSSPYAPQPPGLHPTTACSIAYFGAVIFFFVGFNFSYEKVVARPLIGNLLPDFLLNRYPAVVVLPLVMWGVHYIRRLGEVLFLHEYKRKMGFFESSGASMYYWGFGLWIGLSQNFHLGYIAPSAGFIYAGLALFLLGEAGNCCAHIALKALRQQPQHPIQTTAAQRVLPTGPLFEYVSCPHYTFELVTWMGYALVSMTMSSLVFLSCSAITLFIYADKHHKQYVKEFDGSENKLLYPAKRKAIIPFIF